MKKTTGVAVCALIGLFGMAGVASADTTVRVLTIVPNDFAERDINAQTVKDFEAAHPGVKVTFDYLENEAYKTKLPTVLQSSQRPHIFQSWGGGVLNDQIKAGILEDLTPVVKADFEANFPKAGLDVYTVDGKIYGAPRVSTMVVMWYNKDLAAKAGVDPAKIKTWDDFLAAVKKAKDAGVTPIVTGGKDKWPVHFYYGYLALRIAGKAGLDAAKAGKDGGFENPAFIKVGEEFKKLVDLKPFQEGFADATFDKSSGQFGDGQALFHLNGSFAYSVHKRNAVDGKGFDDSKLGYIPFPAVAGGKGDPSDVFGGADGWIVSKGAPKEATQFMAYMVSKKIQDRSAEAGLWIPAAKGSGEQLKNPFFKSISVDVSKAKEFQLFLDQAFGPAVGGAVNEASADLALGVTTPKDAAAHIEEARKMAQ
jgi:raffinose/stachyose/melibiose transport system substrate-binding protein